MKKSFGYFLAGLLIMSFLNGCKKDDPDIGGTQLLKVFNGGTLSRTYSYNSIGQIARIDYPSGGYYIYEYGDNGYLSTGSSYDSQSVVQAKWEYTYDSYKRLIKRDYKKLINGSIRLYQSVTFEYSNDDKTITEYEHDSTNILNHFVERKFDSNDNLYELSYFKGDDSIKSATFYFTYGDLLDPFYSAWEKMGVHVIASKNNILSITSNKPDDDGVVYVLLNDNLSMEYDLYDAVYESNDENMVTKQTINYHNGTSSITTYEYK